MRSVYSSFNQKIFIKNTFNHIFSLLLYSNVYLTDEEHNIQQLGIFKDPHESPLKIVFATIALGMGADLRHVSQVIHIGPPKNMEGK